MTATLLPGTDRPAAPPVVNLPNALTLGRLLVVPVFAFLLLTAGDSTGVRVLLWGLFTAACITDVIDGHLARRRSQVTEFGVMADPIADKALVGSALVGLSLLGELPWWVTAVVLGREVGVTLLRVWLVRGGARAMPASRGGKLKALSQNAAVALYLLPLSGLLATARVPVLLLAVAATVLTGLDYAVKGLRLRRAGRAAS